MSRYGVVRGYDVEYGDDCGEGEEFDEEDNYDPMSNEAPCSCTLCPCMNEVEGGGVCSECREGAHQG